MQGSGLSEKLMGLTVWSSPCLSPTIQCTTRQLSYFQKQTNVIVFTLQTETWQTSSYVLSMTPSYRCLLPRAASYLRPRPQITYNCQYGIITKLSTCCSPHISPTLFLIMPQIMKEIGNSNQRHSLLANGVHVFASPAD